MTDDASSRETPGSPSSIPITNWKPSSKSISTAYRKEFVQFLFSLCVAQAAIFLAALATVDPLWSWDKLAALSHISLAVIVIWSSWFGWRKSVEAQNLDETHPFGRAAILALLDISLVILYFMLTRSADIVNVEQGKMALARTALEPPTPYRESRLMIAIFMVFIVWDCVSKWGDKMAGWPPKCPSKRWKWPWPSLCCLIAAVLVSGAASLFHKTGNVPVSVCFDIALVCLVFMFRQLKEAQLKNIEIAKLESNTTDSSEASLKTARHNARKWRWAAIGSLAGCSIFVSLAALMLNLAPHWVIEAKPGTNAPFESTSSNDRSHFNNRSNQ